MVVQMACTLVGGLGIFLLGMKNMSEGTQAVAGNSLRRLISAVTNNRLLATTVGLVVTCLVQSSSVTTVMVVGFVNSGIMNLMQAIGVIMGANIGTTITGWILVLQVGKYGLPMLGAAAFVYLFARGDRWRYVAMAIMGVGMVFFGLELMKNACADIHSLPDFEAWLRRFRADSRLGVMQCMTVGCALTMIVQSSSATLGVTIALALTGAISYPSAAALVLGENVGTTITAVLASIGATTNARRAAYFHVIFNMLGVTWMFFIFFWYVRFVPWVISADVGREVVKNGVVTFPETTAAIAATHTIFNVTNTLLFLPFLQVFAHILERFVPESGHKETPHLTSLDVRMLETPVIAIEQSRAELLHMASGCNKMMAWLKQLATQDAPDHALIKKLFHREEVLDTIQDEVIAFISDLLTANLPHAITDEGRRQLRMADEYESISDHIADLLKFRLKLSGQGYCFSAEQQASLLVLHGMITEYLAIIAQAYQQRFPEVITKATSLGREIKHQVKLLHKEHLDGLSREKMEPQVNVAYMATLTSYLRVRNDALNVAEAVAGLK